MLNKEINIHNSIIENLENNYYNLKNLNENEIIKLDLLNIYKILNTLLYSNNFDTYNIILKDIDIKKLEIVVIIALLRLSYTNKNYISEWNIFLEKTKVELLFRKKNINELLIGLI